MPWPMGSYPGGTVTFRWKFCSRRPRRQAASLPLSWVRWIPLDTSLLSNGVYELESRALTRMRGDLALQAIASCLSIETADLLELPVGRGFRITLYLPGCRRIRCRTAGIRILFSKKGSDMRFT